MKKTKVLNIDGVGYVPASSQLAEPQNGLEYKIVRTKSAGVFAGYLESRNGIEATILNARRLWYWKGAASLSQLAVDGVSCPDECKFPCEVARVELIGVIEILSVTEKARKSIAEVKLWEA